MAALWAWPQLAFARAPPPWIDATPGMRTTTHPSPPSGRRGPPPAGIAESWEVLVHQRQDRAPVGVKAAAGSASSRVRRGQRELLDQVGVVEARRDGKHRCDPVHADAR